MANFRLTESYPAGTATGACYFCRASQREINNRPERLIDTMIYIEMEGYIILCETCTTEAAGLVDMISAKSATELRADYKRMQDELFDAKAKLVIAQDAVTSLTRYNEVLKTPSPKEVANVK